MTIIIFLLILAILVFVHELGHFLAAKLFGIRVDEFGLGFPPRIASFKYGETVYSLNILFFGGFVKIFGEDGEKENPADVSIQSTSKSFSSKPTYIQVIVLASGVLFNLIFAWILLSSLFMVGIPSSIDTNSTAGQVTILSVNPGSPAEQAGLHEGDHITALHAGSQDLSAISVQGVIDFTSAHSQVPITLSYERSGQIHTADITPQIDASSGRAIMGVELAEVGTTKAPFFSALWQGLVFTWSLMWATITGLFQFVGQIGIGHANFSEVTGPVGIAGMVGTAVGLGFVYLVSFVALISINLAVINLVPFPALDGGRILISIIEKIKGSPIKQNIVGALNTTGFVLLILLMGIVTYHDIIGLMK